jgi:tight adherence protein B
MSGAAVTMAIAATLAAAAAIDLLALAVPAARRVVRERPAPGLGALERPPVIVAAACAGGLLLLLGAVVPGLLVALGPPAVRATRRRHQERRRRALRDGAPLVARAIADGLDAGSPVRGAIVEAAATGPPGAAGRELQVVAARLRAGDPLTASIVAWRRRTGDHAHVALVAGLLLHGEAGGELAAVLRAQADALERRRRATAEAESATVQARTAARIVGGLPVLIAVAVAVLAPDAIGAVTADAIGVGLVLLAVVLQVAAVVAVRRLTAELAR